MATLTEWQHKLAKDDKAVLVQYINETKEALHLDFFDVEHGKAIESKKVPKELKVTLPPLRQVPHSQAWFQRYPRFEDCITQEREKTDKSYYPLGG
jgi:hypothetical protein